MKWLKEDVETAISLNKSGRRIEEIAKILNREFRSVQIKLQKLGFKQNKRQTTENVKCLNCGKAFTSLIKKKRKFCSQSCGAEYNNKKHPKRVNINKLKNCLYCGQPLNSHQNKFCSQKCSGEYFQQENFKKIESGNASFSATMYKKYLIYKHSNKCMKCGWHEVNPTTGLVPIQLEHKDGNSENHNLNNLELLCPNHHSLTPTYGALNKGNGRTKRRERRKSLVQIS
jgi:predicted nucleic acid-binding Zn ribbon protein